MQREKIQLTEKLAIETYPFSDYITCVEVFVNGESCTVLCSDHSNVNEWVENPDLLIEVCQDHILQQPKQEPNQSSERVVLEKGMEIEFFSFSADVYCINVYTYNELATSFCADRDSIEEWQDDPLSMIPVIKDLLKG